MITRALKVIALPWARINQLLCLLPSLTNFKSNRNFTSHSLRESKRRNGVKEPVQRKIFHIPKCKLKLLWDIQDISMKSQVNQDISPYAKILVAWLGAHTHQNNSTDLISLVLAYQFTSSCLRASSSSSASAQQLAVFSFTIMNMELWVNKQLMPFSRHLPSGLLAISVRQVISVFRETSKFTILLAFGALQVLK